MRPASLRAVSSRCGQAQIFNQRMVDAIRQILDLEPLYRKDRQYDHHNSARSNEKFQAASRPWRPDGMRGWAP
jgi:hypothetical protein